MNVDKATQLCYNLVMTRQVYVARRFVRKCVRHKALHRHPLFATVEKVLCRTHSNTRGSYITIPKHNNTISVS